MKNFMLNYELYLSIIVFTLLVILFIITGMLCKYIWKDKFNHKKIDTFTFISFVLIITFTFSIYQEIKFKNNNFRHNNLMENGYFYTKTISGEKLINAHLYINNYVNSMCPETEYRAVNNRYQTIDEKKPIINKNAIHIYCKESEKNKKLENIARDNFDNDFLIKSSFPKYPSTYAIREHCELENSYIIDKDGNLTQDKNLTLNNLFFLKCVKSTTSP